MRIILIIYTILILFQSCSKETSQTDRIVDFAKTYGLVKYFYPGDESAMLDWDRFGVYASKQLIRKDQEVKLAQLFEWASAVSISSEQIDTSYLEKLTNKNAVYWQHIGNGEGKVGYHYKSARMNRKARVLPSSSNDFGTLYSTINSEDIQLKNVQAKAKIRISSTYQGVAFLRIRIKLKNQPWKEVTSETFGESKGKWVELKVEHEIPDSTEKVTLALYSICQTGHIDVDDLKFSSLDSNGDNVIIEDDFRYSEIGEAWKTFGPNQEFKIIEGKGFLRIARAEGNLKTINPLYSPKLPTPRIAKVKLTESSYLQFPLVLPSIDSMTIPKASADVWNKLNKRIEDIDPDEQVLTQEHVRLSNIIKVWNVFQHFYPYFDRTEVDWEEELRTAIERNKMDKNKKDHVLTLKRMVASLNDSHIGVYTNNPDFFPSFSFEWIDNQLVITSVIDSIAGIEPGDIVVSVNEVPVETYWKNILIQSSGANSERKNYQGIFEALAGDQNDSISLKVNDKDYPIFFTRSLSEEDFETMINLRPEQPYYEPKKGIKYIDLTRVSWEFINENLDSISNSRGLIFDLRGYPQWKTIEIVRHFSKDTLKAIQTYETHVSFPDRLQTEYIKEEQRKFSPKEPFIALPKLFLTNASAISYSETFLNIVSNYKLASVVGTRTAGTTGNTNTIFLYGNISIPWTGKKVTDQNGDEFHGIGIQPDYEINKTIKGVRKNKDEIFEYAVKLLTEQRDALEQKR